MTQLCESAEEQEQICRPSINLQICKVSMLWLMRKELALMVERWAQYRIHLAVH